MQITSLRLGLTKNLGNYESAKLECEAIPTDGQTAGELLSELNNYVVSELAKAGQNGTPPMKAGGNSGKAGAATEGNTAPAKPPASKGTKATKAKATKPKVGKKEKDAAKKELQYAIDSESHQELLDRFNDLRDPGKPFITTFTLDEWADAVNSVASRYKALNQKHADAGTVDLIDAKVQSQIVDAGKSERDLIARRRAEAAPNEETKQ